jgi:hypothetical protein
VKYYIQRHGKVEGPLTVDEINSKLASGVIDSHWLATADLGETFERIVKTSHRDWVPLADIPGTALLFDKNTVADEALIASGGRPGGRSLSNVVFSSRLLIKHSARTLKFRFIY